MHGTINGSGKPVSAMLLMIFYYIVVGIPLAKLLSITQLKLNGIWLAVLISHIAAATASLLYSRHMLKQKTKLMSAII